jgi:hypothetical protein
MDLNTSAILQRRSHLAGWYAGHTPEQILEYVSDRVAAKDRSKVQIQRIDKRQTSSHISPCDGPHFQIIARAIRDTMGRPEVGKVSSIPIHSNNGSLAVIAPIGMLSVPHFAPQEKILVAPYLVVGEALCRNTCVQSLGNCLT